MRKLLLVVVACLFLLPAWTELSAQYRATPRLEVTGDSTEVLEITLRDGTTLVGRIAAIADGGVTLRTLIGVELTVGAEDIVGVRRLAGSVQRGEFWEDDLSDSRLFLGPTARIPPNGRGYVGVYELFFLSVGAGLGDVAMLSAGMSLVPGVDVADQVFYLAPKVRMVKLPGLEAAAGVFWVKPGSSEESAGLAFGNVTIGNRQAAATIGLGFPFASEAGFADDPWVMVGGELRVDRRLKLMSENWVVPGTEATIVSFGLRIIARKLTVEVGAVTATGSGGFLPIVSFSTAW